MTRIKLTVVLESRWKLSWFLGYRMNKRKRVMEKTVRLEGELHDHVFLGDNGSIVKLSSQDVVKAATMKSVRIHA